MIYLRSPQQNLAIVRQKVHARTTATLRALATARASLAAPEPTPPTVATPSEAPPAATLISLHEALVRCTSRPLSIATVIDVGASNGMWSREVRPFFPEAFYYLIEANPVHTEGLEQIQQEWAGQCAYLLAAAGDKDDQIYFEGSSPFGGFASHTPTDQTTLVVPVARVDTIVAEHQLAPPYLLKLDTHGFEIPIFEGAAHTLTQTELIVVETYNFDIAPGSQRFGAICAYLEKRGFRCIDFCDPLFRPKDGAFWQFDLFFVPATQSLFHDNTWG